MRRENAPSPKIGSGGKKVLRIFRPSHFHPHHSYTVPPIAQRDSCGAMVNSKRNLQLTVTSPVEKETGASMGSDRATEDWTTQGVSSYIRPRQKHRGEMSCGYRWGSSRDGRGSRGIYTRPEILIPYRSEHSRKHSQKFRKRQFTNNTDRSLLECALRYPLRGKLTSYEAGCIQYQTPGIKIKIPSTTRQRGPGCTMFWYSGIFSEKYANVGELACGHTPVMTWTFCLVPPPQSIVENLMVHYSSNAIQRCRHFDLVINHCKRSRYYLEGIDHPFVEGISTTAG